MKPGRLRLGWEDNMKRDVDKSGRGMEDQKKRYGGKIRRRKINLKLKNGIKPVSSLTLEN